MLAQLASLACVKPLITYEVYQLAHAEVSIHSGLQHAEKEERQVYFSWCAGKILSQHPLVCKKHKLHVKQEARISNNHSVLKNFVQVLLYVNRFSHSLK